MIPIVTYLKRLGNLLNNFDKTLKKLKEVNVPMPIQQAAKKIREDLNNEIKKKR